MRFRLRQRGGDSRFSAILGQRGAHPIDRVAALVSSVVLVLGVAFFATACGDDTFTPDACPPQASYDIREVFAEENDNNAEIVETRRRVESQVNAAAERGCVTAPNDPPPLNRESNSRQQLTSSLTLANDAGAMTEAVESE